MQLPLQRVVYISEADPATLLWFFGGLAVVVLIAAAVRIIRGGTAPSTRSAKPSGPRRFNAWALRQAAAAYGLDHDQIAFLDGVFRRAEISDPARVMDDAAVLDRHLKKAYRSIETAAETEAAADQQKALLFSIRQAIDASKATDGRVLSSRRLPDGLSATLVGPKEETYPTRIVSAKNDRLVVEAPRGPRGDALRLPRGSKVALTFYAKGGQGYRFETSTYGTIAGPSGERLELSHSDRIAPLPSRKHLRKEISHSCTFSLARQEKRLIGARTETKTVFDDKKNFGTMMDVSIGGCAIKAALPLHAGDYLRIDFEDGHDRSVAALGRVVRTNRTGNVGGVMHIQFAKAPRRTLNAVWAMVLGYDQD
jgi:hypothetical protein